MEKFSEIIHSDQAILVDFYATWCGPCQTISPIIQDVAKEVQGKARVFKIDVDKNPKLSKLYKVRSVPTLIIFKKGEIIWRHSGIIYKDSLLQKLKSFTKRQ